MVASIVLYPQARVDLVEQTAFIAEESIEASDKFLECVQESLELLSQMPELDALREFRNPRLTGLRIWPVKRFERRLIFYRAVPDGLEVIRILHSSRDVESIMADPDA